MKSGLACSLARRLFCWLALVTLSPAVQAAVIDTVNAGKTPDGGTFQAAEVGWFYTPNVSFVMTGIEARFGFYNQPTAATGPDVFAGDVGPTLATVEIYSNHPSASGVLLRTAVFTVLEDAYAGGLFAGLSVTAGTSYFVGFRNLIGQPLIYTSGAGAESLLPGMYIGLTDAGLYGVGPLTGLGYENPILQFSGELSPSSVPEPSTLAIFGFTVGLIGVRVLRRRRQQ